MPKRVSISGELDRGVLDHVVQQAGGDRGGVEPVAGQDVGNGERVGEVGIAVVAPLCAVRLHRQHVGGVDQAGVGLGVVGVDFLGQLELADDGGAGGAGTGIDRR